MTRILRDKFRSLVYGDDGVALVITLAVFFLLYLLCMGAFAVGTAVKERIQLQNACDAAAYSAAVVQADTLSRIATLNRAMSWTYVQMTRRQMDYIVYKWLDEACRHHAEDAAKAAFYALQHNNCTHGGKCPICTMPPIGWRIDDIKLHGSNATHGPYSESMLSSIYENRFPSWMKSNSLESFYSHQPTLAGLGNQIDDDLDTIDAINSAETDLIGKMPGRVRKAAEDVVHANLAHVDRSRYGDPKVYQCEHPIDTYFRELHNTESDEKTFIGFVGKDYLDYFKWGGSIGGEKVFDKGTDDWFVRGEGAPIVAWNAPKGLHRSYDHSRLKPLYATWRWYATGWTCGIIEGIHWMVPTSYASSSECLHGLHDVVRCRCKNSDEAESGKHNLGQGIWRNGVFKGLRSQVSVFRKWIHAVCYADNARSYDDRYKGRRKNKAVYAHPQLLSKEYFGGDGTITVGLAMANRNPLAAIWGDGKTIRWSGILSAFNPFCLNTVVFSSAKAGYKRIGEEYEHDDDGNLTREYRIDWDNNQDWNLCQSDWDAVFVPVRMAQTMAKDGGWGTSKNDFLGAWVERLLIHSTASMRSGSAWLIENRSAEADWNRLTERMFH